MRNGQRTSRSLYKKACEFAGMSVYQIDAAMIFAWATS